MSVCTFIAASCSLKEFTPSQEYPLEINIDKGTVYDGDADENFSLLTLQEYPECTSLKHVVALEWAYYTHGRAERIIKYIREVLERTDTVELWHIWLGTLDEFEERPIIRTCTVGIDDLTVERIKEIDSADIWMKQGSVRPIFRCMRIIKL